MMRSRPVSSCGHTWFRHGYGEYTTVSMVPLKNQLEKADERWMLETIRVYPMHKVHISVEGITKATRP